MRLVFFSLLLVVWSGLAFAQDQMAQNADTPLADDTRQVLVIGDQLAAPMSNGLTRMIAADDQARFTVVNRSNEGSGLARPEIYDWVSAIPKMVEGKNFSAAVVLMGLNDRRDMRDGDNVLKFGTPEWDTLYKTRIDSLIDALKAANIQAFWMGEPPMGDPLLDADMQNITALIKERVDAKGAVFIDLRTPFLGANGGYVDRGPDDTGADRRLREGDGVTFMKVGNNRLGQIALQALKSGTVATPAPQAQAPADPNQATLPAQTAAVAPQTAPADEGPIFGQEGDDIAGAVNGSSALSAEVEKDRASKKAASESIIGVAAAKGSSAEALFTKGIAPPAPQGRFDDFTAVAP